MKPLNHVFIHPLPERHMRGINYSAVISCYNSFSQSLSSWDFQPSLSLSAEDKLTHHCCTLTQGGKIPTCLQKCTPNLLVTLTKSKPISNENQASYSLFFSCETRLLTDTQQSKTEDVTVLCK